jgi:hypothetical protein
MTVFFLGVLFGVDISIGLALPMLPPSRKRNALAVGAIVLGSATVLIALWIIL